MSRSPRSPQVPSPSDVPLVEIRAVAFHRWRTLKWLVRFTEPGTGASRQCRCATFDDAVQAARQWSLAYRVGLSAAEQVAQDTGRESSDSAGVVPGGLSLVF